MKREVLMSMSKTELDEYARVLGIDASGKKTVAAKVELIEKRRGRTAEIDALGLTLTIPVKRMHDKRVTDLEGKRPMSDEDATRLLALILGDEQMEKLVERATDEDGVVDVDALGLAMARVLASSDLKNF